MQTNTTTNGSRILWSLWAHLPNAKIIDAILDSLRRRSGVWCAAGAQSLCTGLSSADLYSFRRIAERMVADAGNRSAMEELTQQVHHIYHRRPEWKMQVAAKDAALTAILALVAYSDAAYLLNSDPDELKVIIALSGMTNQAAILLLPAVIAMQEKYHAPNRVVTSTKCQIH